MLPEAQRYGYVLQLSCVGGGTTFVLIKQKGRIYVFGLQSGPRYKA
jgi:hypothetical protein